MAAAVMSACGSMQRNSIVDMPQSDGVGILCFHGAKRCATCLAIEDGIKELLETDFAAQIASGELRFRIVDIAKPENEPLADRYEVSWSALLLCQWRDGVESVTDLTKQAFADARANPEKFKAELQAEIRKQLEI